MSETKYYSLDKILQLKAQYNVIFGERSNGKTYAVLKYAIERYAKTGEQLAIIRRYRDDFIGRRGAEYFSALIANEEVKRATKGKWTSIHYYGGRWFFSRYEKDRKGNEKRIVDETPFAYGFALTTMEHDKGAAYPDVTTIMFDEFLTRTGYLADEFVLFTNVISTIIRHRDDVKIFMLGNTVNKYCPYFAEMGLKHIPEMNPGDIDQYHLGDTGLTIAVEYCGEAAKHMGKKSDKYFAFDNPKLKMITSGAWEIDIYPHAPCKWLPRDVLFRFFIKFDENLLQGDVVRTDTSSFVFIHRKTTPIKDEDYDLVFSPEYDPRPNWFRKITIPSQPVIKKLLLYFQADQVYYQDNEVGEVVRNYLSWCGKVMK